MTHPFLKRVRTYGQMIKFSHTLFAMPFALAAFILAWDQYPVTAAQLFYILLALVGARSAAMGFNRIVDAGIDKKNPRTALREIPSGTLSAASAWTFVVLSSVLFIGAAALLGPLCLALSLPVLAILLGYSYTKRFTWLCHLYLGAAIALAPLGTWVAVSGRIDGVPVLLSMGLMAYIAGFDILYACQDTDFDREMGLYSIPSRLGVSQGLFIAKCLHGFFFAMLVGVGVHAGLSNGYGIAVGVIALLIIIEHRLVSPDDLSNIHIAFFHMNSAISVTLLAGVVLDRWI